MQIMLTMHRVVLEGWWRPIGQSCVIKSWVCPDFDIHKHYKTLMIYIVLCKIPHCECNLKKIGCSSFPQIDISSPEKNTSSLQKINISIPQIF